MLDEFPYVVGQPAEIFHNGKWIQGKIVAGYRFRDGIVTIQTNTGERIWCGETRKELYRPLVLNMMVDEKIKKIACHYGYEAQSRQCIEEMAELTQAINKFWRKQLNCGKKPLNDVPFGTIEENNIEEELVDVYIMILQMKYLHKISVLEFETAVKRKLDRQLRRMEEENADQNAKQDVCM